MLREAPEQMRRLIGEQVGDLELEERVALGGDLNSA
jgi:hypothetical protein